MTTEELLTEVSSRLYLLNKIQSSPNCNTCTDREHSFCPSWGDDIVYNCPFYTEDIKK